MKFYFVKKLINYQSKKTFVSAKYYNEILREIFRLLAGSVVAKNITPYTVVGGNPAKNIKDRINEINYTQRYKYLFAL
jgi:hypothetical protein